jgi:hypothetical protein
MALDRAQSGNDRPTGRLLLCLLSVLGFGACGQELGECNDDAARQLVYSSSGLVATKGQALLHDSCGQGTFCHSGQAARGARLGAPRGLDLDVLPQPKSLDRIVEMRDQIWQQVESGLMPPKNHAVGNGKWSFDVERHPEAAELAPLSSAESKTALRNWLACGAPSVTSTSVPDWAMVPSKVVAAEEQAWHERRWTRVHGQLQAGCMRSACHDAQEDVDASPLGELAPMPLYGGECAVYRWLLYKRDRCGELLVRAGEPDKSALVHKIEDDAPACGRRMPPDGARNSGLVALVRDWIQQGAWAPQCGAWSDEVARSGLDAGAPAGPPSWSELYAGVIKPKCATAGCHVGASSANAGNLDLSEECGAWRALRAPGACGARVVAGDPSASSLYDKVASRTPACQGPMPPTGQLPRSNLDAIRTWIEAGATADSCE